MARRNRSIPESAKLTAIMLVAEEDWITAVKKNPTIIPMNRLVVKSSKICRSFAPATFSMDSLIRLIPNKNSPNPPAIVSIILIKLSVLIFLSQNPFKDFYPFRDFFPR